MKKITLSIYVPCHNEENLIIKTLNKIREAVEPLSYEIIAVDDGSKDKTIEMIEKFKQNNPNVIVKLISNEKNRGIGYNHRAAAREASGKYLMMITGDSDEPAHELKKIISNIGKADMILCYLVDVRRIERRTLSRMFVFIINLITLNNIKYYNGPNIHLLENVKLYSGRRSGFGYQAELVTAQLRENKTYIEVEINPVPCNQLELLGIIRKLPSVGASIILIFFHQVIYKVKKILKIK